MGSAFKKINGSSSSSAPSKSVATPASYINEIAGYEQVPVKNKDGSITYITRELKLSPEEQAKKDQLDIMANNALAEIEKLSSLDYTSSESVQSLLDGWQENKLNNVSESFDDRKEQELDSLAKRGLSDSTAANTVERQTKQDEYDAKNEVSNEKSLIAEQLRQKELSNQQNLYNLAQNQINYDAAQLANNSKGDLSAINAINTTNAASINDYYSRQNQAGVNQSAFLTSVLDPLMSQAGSTASSSLDAGVDGLVKTITGGFL